MPRLTRCEDVNAVSKRAKKDGGGWAMEEF